MVTVARYGASEVHQRQVTARRELVAAMVNPVAKAYLLGFAADAAPAILRAILRFIAVESRSVRTARKDKRLSAAASGIEITRRKDSNGDEAAEVSAQLPSSKRKRGLDWDELKPSLRAIPTLLRAILRVLIQALYKGTSGGQLGMAPACAMAIAGWTLLDTLLNSALSLISSVNATVASTDVRRLRILACFLSASVSASLALTLLQELSKLPGASSSAATSSRRIGDAEKGTGPPRPVSRSGSTLLSFLAAPSRPGSPVTFNDHHTSGPQSPQSGQGVAPSTSWARRLHVPIPTPLAPGGHFLARLTSFNISSSPSPSAPLTPTAATPAVSPRSSELQLTTVEKLEAQVESDSEDDRVPRSRSTTLDQFHPGVTPAPEPASPPPDTKLRLSPLAQLRAHRAKPTPSATIDLTLFTLVRGMDTFVRAVPLIMGALVSKGPGGQADVMTKGKGKTSTAAVGTLARVAGFVASQAEGLTFVVCCAQIMWAWFYHPERLPPSYVKWISNLASMDERLLIYLRAMRNQHPLPLGYGREGGDFLMNLSSELGYPPAWGKMSSMPSETSQSLEQVRRARAHLASLKQGNASAADVRRAELDCDEARRFYTAAGCKGPRGEGLQAGLPCEVVHCGVGGHSCVANAGLRWLRGFRVCMGIYVPVHFLPRLLFNPRGVLRNPLRTLRSVLEGSTRSASFLASFIALTWFMVCLTRSLLLPRLFPRVSWSYWDGGLGPWLGSLACGLSVFIEEKRKRAEMALYVAPRALFAVAESARPGWLSGGKKGALRAERIVFGIAVGIIVSAGRYRPDLLRGITSTMAWVVKERAASRPVAVRS